MNADLQGQRILSIYWAVAPVALHGVLDQIRTALTLLVAELRAHTPEGEAVPSADVASQAVQVVVSGKRHRVSVNTAQAAGAPASVDVAPAIRDTDDSPFWTRSRRIGAFVVGSATIVGAATAVVAIAH